MATAATHVRLIAPILAAAIVCPVDASSLQVHGDQAPAAVDVALTHTGLLVGQVVDAQGSPRMGVRVQLHTPAGEIVPSATDRRGHFAYRSVEPGVFHIESAAGQVRSVRVWTTAAAPPSARRGVLLVEGDAVRGQHCPPSKVNTVVGKAKRAMANPLVVTGVIATAVGIPVAVHNADSGS